MMDSFGTRGDPVARRQLLTEEERQLLFGTPRDADALTRQYQLHSVRTGNFWRCGAATPIAWGLLCSSHCCGIPA